MSENQLTLGLLLLKEGMISKDQLKKALLKQGEIRRFGRYQRLGEVISKLGILPEGEVQRAVEIQETIAVPNATHTALGLMMIEAGLLTPSQVFNALVEQQFTEKRLGEILVEKGVITQEQMNPFLAKQAEARRAAEEALQDELKEQGLIDDDEDFVIFDMGGDDETLVEAMPVEGIVPAAADGETEAPPHFGYSV